MAIRNLATRLLGVSALVVALASPAGARAPSPALTVVPKLVPSTTTSHRALPKRASMPASVANRGDRTILVPFRLERPPQGDSMMIHVGTAMPATVFATSLSPKVLANLAAAPTLTVRALALAPPKPSPSLQPTAAPKPPPTPQPAAAPRPTPRPQPSAAPKPTPQPTAAPKATPTPHPTVAPKTTPQPISARDLGALDGAALVAIVGHELNVDGYVADAFNVTDGGTTRHVLRIAGSSRADVKLACLLAPTSATGASAPIAFQAHVHIDGYVLASSDRAVGTAARTAPILLSPCRVVR